MSLYFYIVYIYIYCSNDNDTGLCDRFNVIYAVKSCQKWGLPTYDRLYIIFTVYNAYNAGIND